MLPQTEAIKKKLKVLIVLPKGIFDQIKILLSL